MTEPIYVTAAAALWPGGRGISGLLDAPGRAASATVADDELAAALVLRGLRPLSRTARLAMVVAADVWPPGSAPSARAAVVLGSAWASVGPLAEFVQVAAAEGADRVFPMAFPNTVASVHAGYVATLLGLCGPNVSVCGPAAGLEAVVEGLSLLEAGRADLVLAIGADAAEPTLCAAHPDATEAAGAVRLSRTREGAALAEVTGWWSTPHGEDLPEPSAGPDLAAILGPCAAALGVVEVGAAAYLVARTGLPRVVTGRCGVRGHAAVRLAPVV